MHDRKFRFGVMCSHADSATDFREKARKAEALGYSTLFVPDHFVDHPLAPMPAMATAAAVTDTLRIGSLVLGNDYKHPVVLAREAATLDLLSDGRLELGLGAGWMTADYDKAGLDLDRPGVRIDRLEESVTVLKGLMGDDPFTFHGKHYTVTDLDGQPKPVQRPQPPFIIGGGGPKILALAAREAAIVGINANLRRGVAISDDAARSMTGSATDEKLARLRAAGGERFGEIEIQSFVGFTNFTDDRQALAEMMAGAFGVAPEEALETPVVLAGTLEQMIDDVQARRERWEMSYVVVGVDVMEQFAPAVARLAGT
ncbi:MAG: TIGR03621 family F420-dependent LLM class oxidoreductase [Actinomycetota bacterium]|nr:TIGR03621 family F420-dependent LLM class oxidoreductase [Actinomycetota bacterium]